MFNRPVIAIFGNTAGVLPKSYGLRNGRGLSSSSGVCIAGQDYLTSRVEPGRGQESAILRSQRLEERVQGEGEGVGGEEKEDNGE